MNPREGEGVETSLAFSLQELRRLAQLRSLEQEQARRAMAAAAEAARQRAREEAEAQARAAAEAELAAEELAWQRAVAESKAVAERLEAAERAERARALIELEQARAATEAELARAARRRRRPGWLIALSVTLASSTAALAGVSWQWHTEAAARQRAAEERLAAREERTLQIEQLEQRLVKEAERFGLLDDRLATTRQTLSAAEAAAERDAEKRARLAQAEQRRLEDKRKKEEEDRRKREEGEKPIEISAECARGALCK